MKRTAARPAAISVLIVMLFAAGWAIGQLPGIELENSVYTWLSPDAPEAQVLRWCRQKFPEKNEVLVSWSGSSLDDPRVERFAEALTGKLDESRVRVGGLDCISDVITPGKLLDRMARQDIAKSQAIESLRGTLIGVVDGDSQSGDAPVAILVILSESGSAKARASLNAIRDAAVRCGIEPPDLHLGGDIVTSSALDDEVLSATWNGTDPLQRPPVFLLSGLAGALLAVVVLRSVRLGIMVLICACITALVGTALVPFSGHTMNMVLIVMPTLLIVLALSAAIHVANYWKHAVISGINHPVRQAMRMAWLPCFLAAVTTGIGLMSLSISSLVPIRDFGIFASIGTLISLAVVMIGLPAMMVVCRVPSPTRSEVDHHIWRWLGSVLSRYCGQVAGTGLLLFIATTVGLYWFRSEVKVERYFPENSQLTVDYEFLETNLGGVVPVEILVSFNEGSSESLGFLERMELIRTVENQVRQHPEISGALSLADFQPEIAPLGDDAGFLARTQHAVRARAMEAQVKQTLADASGASEFLTADNADGSGDWMPGAPPDEIWRIRAQAHVTSEVDYGELTADLNDIITTVLEKRPGIEHTVTGTVPVFFRAQEALLQSLIQSFCLAFAVIALAMIVLLRSLGAGILCMLPNLMPVGMVFGGLSWCGQTLDIGSMLTASVALGISVDGMLHLLTWFRKAITEGRSRQDAVTFALQHCGPAMIQTSAVVGLSLLVLYPAELLLISRFGWVMATLLGFALVAELVFLPVLLIGPLGRMIQHSVSTTESCERQVESSGNSDCQPRKDEPVCTVVKPAMKQSSIDQSIDDESEQKPCTMLLNGQMNSEDPGSARAA